MKKNIRTIFGTRLKTLRNNEGLTLDQLADLYNNMFNGKMYKGTISRYEHNLQEPGMTIAMNFSKLFNVEINWLMGEDIINIDSNNIDLDANANISKKEKMDFYEILSKIMSEKSMGISEVAHATGLPDSTVRSIIARKTKKISLDVALKISKGLNISVDRLNGESVQDEIDLNNEEKEVVKKYRALSESRKNDIKNLLDMYYEECAAEDTDYIDERA